MEFLEEICVRSRRPLTLGSTKQLALPDLLLAFVVMLNFSMATGDIPPKRVNGKTACQSDQPNSPALEGLFW